VNSILPKNPIIRAVIFGPLAVIVTLVITQILLPGGTGGSGTPAAILFQGFVFGMLAALIAIGLVLIYRSSNIINFAQAALGAAGGVFFFNFSVLNGWPFVLALLAGLIVASALGFVVEVALIRRFAKAPRLVLTVLTIALIGFISQGAGQLNNLPIFEDVQDRTLEETAGRGFVAPFPDFKFRFGEFPLDFNSGHLMAIGLAMLALLGVGAYLKFSTSGTAIRAIADNPERAPMLGINIGKLSRIVWTIAAFLSGLGVIMGGVVVGQFSSTAASVESLLIGLVAATFARMRSLWVAAYSAILISILRQAVDYSYREQLALLNLGMTLFVAGALLTHRRREERSEALEVSAWKATEEHRSIPREMLELSGVRIWRRVLVAAAALTVLAFPWVVDSRPANLAGYNAIVGISILSLVILTGWAGQVSLGQFGLVAVGAVIGGAITARLGWSFWFSLVVTPLIVAFFSLIIGLPALRIKGLFLGVLTFSFAFMAETFFFSEKYFGWLLSDAVDRPTFFLLDFEDERSMYYLSVLALGAAIAFVLGLRKSRFGRLLIGLRDNEPNLQAFGINAVKMRLIAFALSGFLCGFSGVLLAHHQRAVQSSSFDAQLSLDIFLYAVVGGVGSVSGALLGTLYFAIVNQISDVGPLSFLAGPTLILVILYISPGGIASLFFGLRDGVLRIVAQRRQMVVPSLFADIDPDAVRRRLIPLSEPFPNVGLATLPYDQRYRADSGLYGEDRWLGADRAPEEQADAMALGAAAEGLQSETRETAATAAAPAGNPAEGARE
jgi:branched-chain amino acid transport system permease protein